MIHPVLRMGDPRLLRIARPVECFDTVELHALVRDMFDTMADRNGAGLAAPQIGVDLRVVIFGFEHNPRYPDAEPVPPTVLVNPRIEPCPTRSRKAGRGACRCRACGAGCRGSPASATTGSTLRARRSAAKQAAFTHAWSSTSAITSTASSIRGASAT